MHVSAMTGSATVVGNAFNKCRGRALLLWQLGSRWWAVALVLLGWGLIWLVPLALFGSTRMSEDPDKAYLLREFLKDAADVALKTGAVVAGALGIYRYWYHRYEPLVYFVTCGLIPKVLLEDLSRESVEFVTVSKRMKLGTRDPVDLIKRWHDLPLVVLHRRDMDTLGVSDGSQVDLLFRTPDDKSIWASAFVFAFPSTTHAYDAWPLGLSISLRRFFRMERPFQPHFVGRTEPEDPPEGWQKVEASAGQLARFHQATEQGRALIWMASMSYTVRFADPNNPELYHAEDDLDGCPRIFEYSGISLRVFRRTSIRYRGD